MTPEDIEVEFWAYYYAENAGKGEMFEDDDLDVEAIIKRLESGDGDDWEELINDKP